MGLLNAVKVWVHEKLTAADLNAEFQNIYSHLTPDYIEDASKNDGEMLATKDPYPGGALARPASLRDEIKTLRYMIQQITGKDQWPKDPPRSLSDSVSYVGDNTFSGNNIFSGTTTFNDNIELEGEELLARFRDTTEVDGKEWGIRSAGGNLEIIVNTGTTEDPVWEVRKVFYPTHADDFVPDPPDNKTTAGQQKMLVANSSLSFGDFCYLNSSGKMTKGDADALGTSGVCAMAVADIDKDATGPFALPGSFIRNDIWSWTVGAFVYLDTTTAGGLTQTAPSGTDDAIQIVGVAWTEHSIYFLPQLLMYTHV